jgi:hypothetical protein
MLNTNQIKTVSASHVLPNKPGWNASITTGSNIDGAILSVFRMHDNLLNEFGGKGRIQHGYGNKRQFKNRNEAWQWAFEHGYISEYRRTK